jgi:hypothetical protein
VGDGGMLHFEMSFILSIMLMVIAYLITGQIEKVRLRGIDFFTDFFKNSLKLLKK